MNYNASVIGNSHATDWDTYFFRKQEFGEKDSPISLTKTIAWLHVFVAECHSNAVSLPIADLCFLSQVKKSFLVGDFHMGTIFR